MTRPFASLLLLCILPVAADVSAWSVTGRASLFANDSDVSDASSSANLSSQDQQSVRLMLENITDQDETVLHTRVRRRHLSDTTADTLQAPDLFRLRPGKEEWAPDCQNGSCTQIGGEIDRFYYRYHQNQTSWTIGRQALDWGSGRFWQPMNLFGAFAPTELDTDFKSGVDALSAEWYPSLFSSLTWVWVAQSPEAPGQGKNTSIHYRTQMGESSEVALIAGYVLGDPVFAVSFESDWQGMGWRLEAQQKDKGTEGNRFWWIAGIDTQFDDGTLLTLEWHDNAFGAQHVNEISARLTDPGLVYGLEPHTVRHVMGLSLQRTLSPLWQGGYSLFAALLDDEPSYLHQLHAIRSLSNESDLTITLLHTTGRAPKNDLPQSEFGALPDSVSLRLRWYF